MKEISCLSKRLWGRPSGLRGTASCRFAVGEEVLAIGQGAGGGPGRAAPPRCQLSKIENYLALGR
jgi:hypothetical protein